MPKNPTCTHKYHEKPTVYNDLHYGVFFLPVDKEQKK